MNNENILSVNQRHQRETDNWMITRREFLKASGSIIAALSVGAPFAYADESGRKAQLRFGIVTDGHFADTDAKGTRHYSESLAKMKECIALMNKKKVDFLIELGDFKDQGNPASERETLKYLQTIENIFKKFKGPRYHVLGNHDVDSISKQQFLTRVDNTGIVKGSKYYSFDSGGLHLVVLDANYNTDGSDYDHGKFDWTDTNIPPEELDWIRKDLASTSKPVIIFIHQQLDGKGSHYVKNATKVRQILQESKRVLAVFQGHNHAGHYSYIENIHYYTLKAMVEGSGEKNNSYAIVNVDASHNIVVNGYRKALSKKMVKA